MDYLVLHFRRLSLLMMLLLSLACGYWSVRLASADWCARQGTIKGTKKSLALAPGNATYLAYAAIAAEDSGGDGTSLRLQAAQVNPLDSSNWIQLAARSEMQNRATEAERYLLHAFAIDRQFEPRWALANFYFRRGDRGRTLEWARRALDFGRGDLDSVFQLCWSASGNGSEILETAIPPRLEVLGQYLQYLDGTGRLNDADRVVKKLLPVAGVEQRPALVSHCERSLSAGQVDAAITVWNGLLDRGLIQGERIEPGAGKSLVNSEFQRELSGIGFDWRIQPVDGVVVERLPNRAAVRIVFSRNEPENFIILGQFAALAPHHKYKFRFRYETTGMSGAGTNWLIYDSTTKAVLVSAGPTEAGSAGQHTVESQFQTPENCRLARIELRYAREPGTVRPEGSILFSHLELGFAQ